MPTPKKRKNLKAPFLVTFAAMAAVAPAVLSGCGSSVVTGSGGGDCPAAMPGAGTDCSGETLQCGYGEDECGSPIEFTCSGGKWAQSGPTVSCNPPPPDCPAATPAQGSSCPIPGMACTYPGTGGCVFEVQASCDANLTWQVSEIMSPCNPPGCPAEIPTQGEPCVPPWEGTCTYTVDTGCGPLPETAICENGQWSLSTTICNPPPPDYCYSLTTATDCAAQTFCRWLVPGCGDPPLPQAGCFPTYDCATTSDCGVGQTCQEVVINPCYNLPCDACGANVHLCL
jgi:hypothetical protein